MAKILKNNSGSDVTISDTGQTITNGTNHTIDPSQYSLYARSSDTITKLSSGDLVYNDGSNDLSLADATIHLQGSFPSKISTKNEVQPPFAAKTLPDGKKLYKRVHGVTISINNETKNVELVVPYNNCKITGIELIGGNFGDKVNLKVLDTPTGTISTIPNYMLNQFGYNVYITKDYHKETSAYDADLIKDMKLVVEYTTTDTTKNVYVNYILHEVV